MDLNQTFRFYSYTIGAAVSLISGFVLLYAHLKLKHLNRHPGSLILGQCIAHILFDLHWIGGIPSVSKYLVSIGLCEAFGLYSEFSYYTIWGYITILSIEIYLKIKHPTYTRYKTRIYYTHLFIWIFSVFISVLFVVIGDLGQSPLGTCSIKAGSGDQYLIIAPFVVHLPVILYCIGYSIRVSYLTGFRILRNHMLVVVMFLITITPQIVYIAITSLFKLNYDALGNIGVVLGSLSGFFVAAARLGNRRIMHELYLVMFNRDLYKSWITTLASERDKTLGNPQTNDSSPYLGELFYEVTIAVTSNQSIAEVFTTLSLYFLHNPHRDLLDKIRDHHFDEITSEVIYLSENEHMDYTREHIYDECNIYTVRNIPLKLTQYAPTVFNNLRIRLGYNNQVLSESLSPFNNRDLINARNPNPGGGSQSFFASVKDSKFMIKTIQKKEKTVFLKMLREYYYRIRKDPCSRLIRILGLYSIGSNSTHIILMENIIHTPELAYIFDLKGSAFHRRVLTESITNPPKGCVMKDLDFKTLNLGINVDFEVKNQLKNSIKKDVSLLKRYGIMDYSLLLSIYEHTPGVTNRYTIPSPSNFSYALGIIDIFQQFDFRKKTEAELKKMISSDEASSIDPVNYARRFLEFVENDLFTKEDSIYSLL